MCRSSVIEEGIIPFKGFILLVNFIFEKRMERIKRKKKERKIRDL
jgi:hypothetical protein